MKTRYFAVFYALVLILTTAEALQGSNIEAENGVGGYSVGRAYTYSYSSSAQILENTTLALQGQVSLLVLPADSRAEENEILVNISSISAVWVTPRGNTSDLNFLGNLSNWFSLVKEEDGSSISGVYYPRTESNATLAFKKSLSQLISVEGAVSRSIEDGRMYVVKGQSQRTEGHNHVDVHKELQYSSEGILVSAVAQEIVHSNHSHMSPDGAPSSYDLLNFPVQSRSQLTLLSTSIATPTIPRPQGLIRDGVSVTQVHDIAPLSELLPIITSILGSCDSSDCPHLLVPVLQHLDPADARPLLHDLSVPTALKLVVVDALGAAGVDGNSLAPLINADEEEDLVKRILVNLALGHLPATQAAVDSTFSLLSSSLGSDMGTISPHLQHIAILSLGSMASLLAQSNPELAGQITTFLKVELDHAAGLNPTSSSRLRRSADSGQPDSMLHAVVLDSIGNARASELLEGVVRHLTDDSSLSVKHSAVRALGRFETTESAEALLHVAETSEHPSLVHWAAVAYNRHPRRTQDLSHLIETTSHQRSRRQVTDADSAILNVAMPSVNWNRDFGDGNISVSVNRRLGNSFDISAGPVSSRYAFSAYDATTFDANLELSGGLEHNRMLGAEVCLQGVAHYDHNILQSPSYNETAKQFEQLQLVSPRLEQNFMNAYTLISSSETAYSAVAEQVSSALSALPSRVALVHDALARYETAAEAVTDSYLKEKAGEIHLLINNTLAQTQPTITSSVQLISQALADLIPTRPQAFSGTVVVDSLPFIEGRFLVRYIPTAPQQAMANIFNIYRSSLSGFEELQSAYHILDNLLDPYGVNSLWLAPRNYLRNIHSQITILTANIEATIAAAHYLQLSEDDVASLRQLLLAVSSDLQGSLDLMEEAGADVVAAHQELARAFAGSSAGMDTFTRAYEHARQEIDAIFGQKFYPSFPRVLKSCDINGCGYYPSTMSGAYNEGIDVVVSPLTSVPSPLSGYVQLLNISVLPVSMQGLYSGTRYDNAILLIPAESSYNGVYFILSNLIPLPSIGNEPVFVSGGGAIATADVVHIELIKSMNGLNLRLDPTTFLQPNLEPNVSVELECNDVVIDVAGVVVERNLVTRAIMQQSVGMPLVTDVPGHEFPQPFDWISSETHAVQSTDQITFVQSSTFLMVGQIPVQFDFSVVGAYGLNISLHAGFLSRQFQLSSSPSFAGRSQGSVRVGGTTYAVVELQGTMLETELPLTITQESTLWPLTASSAMDIVLVPSTLNLTSQLIRRRTSGSNLGGSSDEVLETDVIWAYSVPPLQQDEFHYEGTLSDSTPPRFTPIDQADCLVRQLPGRNYSNPAFELLVLAGDPQGRPNLKIGVGTSDQADNILPYQEFRGDVVTLYQQLRVAVDLFFTVVATSGSNMESLASCMFPRGHFYDRSPPQARVIPIRTVSSHPSQIQVLLTLFDEFGLEGIQQIAVGRVPGSQGADVQSWTSINTSLIQTPPVENGQVLDKFSFGRPGRLVSDYLEVLYSTSNLSSCGWSCQSRQDCRSFDYSSSDLVCILHSNIEGPANSSAFENIFYTPSLQSARGYWHYEKLGVGNATILLLSDLPLEHGVTYYVNLRLRNLLGYESVVSSPGFLVDLTPPVPVLIGPPATITMTTQDVYPQGCQNISIPIPGCIDGVYPRTLDELFQDGPSSGSVFNGPIPLTDPHFTATTNILSANWNPFLDPESSIFGYTWCIGTTIGSCDVLPFTDPHTTSGILSREAWTLAGVATGLSLAEGPYYITIRATNDIAYGGPLFTTVHHSTSYMVDTTPPVVSDTIDVGYNKSTNQLSVEYTVIDGLGQLALVELALGRSELDTSIVGWRLLTNQPQSGLNRNMVTVLIPDGIPVWLKLRVTDAAGLQSVFAAANYFTVDRTPPITGRVSDGPSVGVDASYVGSSRVYCVNWVEFNDPESGLGAVTWSVVRASGDVNVTSRTLTPEEILDGVACEMLSSLIHNVTYYSQLSVSNAAMEMQAVTASSDGIVVDETPPEIPPGGVVSLNQASAPYITSANSLAVGWPSFVDYESGVDRHVVRVLVNGQEVWSETLGGMEREFLGNTFQFVSGDSVMVEVVGFNGAGGSATMRSLMLTVDLSPPEIMALVDGASLSEDQDYQDNAGNLTVTWSVQDDLSPLTSIAALVYEIRGGQRSRFHPPSPDAVVTLPINQNTTTIGGLQLTSGLRYSVALTVTNGAGLSATLETNGVLVDLTPPIVQSVEVLSDAYFDSNDPVIMTTDVVTIVTNPNLTAVQWDGSDPESGVSQYVVNVVDANGTQVLPMSEIFAGSAIGGTMRLPALPEGLYRVSVMAINNAGTGSLPALSENFRISSGDSAGVVLDGPADISMATTLDMDYTYELTSVTARFFGFTSDECPGGIAQYEWAVRAESPPAVIFPFTTQGIFESDEEPGSGHAQLPVSGLENWIGQRLFVTVRAITGCGRVSQSTSDGFIIDLSPPTLSVLLAGSGRTEHAQNNPGISLYQDTDAYSAHWQASDAESGVSGDVMVRVGTYPGGSDLNGPRPVATDYLRESIRSMEGISSYVTVTASNGAGLESEVVAEPITLDTSPPDSGLINCVISSYPVPLVGVADYTSLINASSGRLICHWSEINDPQSSVIEYMIAIGTSPTDQSVLNSTRLAGNQQSYISDVFTLQTSVPYYVVLTSINGAGLERVFVSTVYFDITPPIFQGSVSVYSNFKMAEYLAGQLTNVSVGTGLESVSCLLDTDIISIVFNSPSETNSGSVGLMYDIGIGYRPGSDDFLSFSPFFPIPLLPVHPLSNGLTTQLYYRLSSIDLAVVGRRPLYLTIKATNGASLQSVHTSGPVYIKSSITMEPDWIFDGFSSSSDIEFQASTNEIGAWFYFGVNCPLQHGRWAVESVDGNLTQPYTNLEPLEVVPGAIYQVRSDLIQLFNQETYRVLVQATDLSGEVHILRSNGVTVTTRAVTPGRVMDGDIPDQDLNYQESATTLRTSWSGFGDNSAEQEIAYYEVAAGTGPSLPQTRSNVAAFVNVGLNTSHVFEDLILVSDSTEYFITVRAYTVSGAFVEASSNGIRVGLQHAIVPGAIALPRYQSDRSSMAVRWIAFQSDLPIRQYEWALGSTRFNNHQLARFCSNTNSNYSTEFDISGFRNVGLDTSLRLRNLLLQDNTTYYFTLRVLDQAKKCVVVTSPEGVTIDETPPLVDESSTTVLLGPMESYQPGSNFVIYVQPYQDLVAEWDEFSDPESGIDYYTVALYPQVSCGNESDGVGMSLFGPLSVGLATTADLGRVQLLPGTSYVAVVTAVNRAGVSTTVLSQPMLVDDSIPIAGTVKDGLFWETDVQYQSDLSMLSAVFAYSMLPPTPNSVIENGPCPNDLYYSLTSFSSDWSTGSSPQLVGYISTATTFSTSQVAVSVNPPGIAITSFRDQTDVNEVVMSGTYQTRVDMRRGGIFQADILSSRGFPTIQMISVTSVLFIDSRADLDVVAKFEPSASSYNFEGNRDFSAFGLQIYNNFSNSTHTLPPRVILWARDPARLGQVLYVERNISQVDLSVTNTYRIDFTVEKTDSLVTRRANLYINNVFTLSLYGLPHLTNSTRIVFTSFNQRGLIPPAPSPSDELSSVAVFGNVSLPSTMSGHLCDFGTPFHSRMSPVVQFHAGIGTRPGLTDVYPFQVVAMPCLSCLPGPCDMYNCDPTCPGDPYLVNISIGNLTLSPGYTAGFDGLLSSSTSPLASMWFQPATYYMVVQATSASGKVFAASSNGVVIDTSPPVSVSPVVNYDLSFSNSRPIRFQGNNSTIAAGWRFRDEQSFVIDYSWAIGTAPFSTDVQDFMSIGMSTEAVASNLILIHNTTYFVTIAATNGAGLRSIATGVGVTYLATELNVTLLDTLVDVEFVRSVTFTDQNGAVTSVRVTDNERRAGVLWRGVTQDIQDLSWQIGSSQGAQDILPPVTISLSDTALPSRARVDDGVLYHGDQVLATVAEVVALYEGREVDPADNAFSLEPGTLLYHSIEFCNFVHICTLAAGIPSIVIRRKDAEATVLFAGAPTRLTVTQLAPGGVNINTVHILDRTYVLQLFTQSGLRLGSALFAGFLDQTDLLRTYRGASLYISNPFMTMSQTSRDVARRFTEFGGPSFYVSFLGQDSLDGPLEVNVTFDPTLDWDVATPELGYWDRETSVWRQVSETCGNMSMVDLRTFTIAVQVCSTITAEATSSSPRRRRQVDPGMGGSGATPTSMSFSVVSYLERAVQFIVMRVGNVSSNTPPELQLPSDPVQVTEDTIYSTTLLYIDAELDTVDFSLESVPMLGNVTLTSGGVLTYVPCHHCTGIDAIQINIQERPIGENHTPLMSSGQLAFQIVNVNDAPSLFVYQQNISSSSAGMEVVQETMVLGYVEANRSSPAPVVSVAAIDVDGYHDDLTFVVLRSGQFGNVGFRTRLDAVGVVESLPLTLPTASTMPELASYYGYVTFLSSYVTYLPSDPNFVGNDTFVIAVRDSRFVRSMSILNVTVEVLPSYCLNDGTCGGSSDDPVCADIAARRGGAEGYNCTCAVDFTGDFCETAVSTAVSPVRDCPPGIPVVQCDGDPCSGAVCPSHSEAQCRPNYCGSCKAEWYLDNNSVTCHADDTSTICYDYVDVTPAVILECANVQCDCPSQPYPCPPDSILVKNRVNNCCVTFECVCPNTSCPLHMECGQGVQPIPRYRGNGFPGRCCPEYNYEDVNECTSRSEHLCSDVCVNEDGTYSCTCPTGMTLAADGYHCGVCPFNGMEYLLGDRVQIGCNWCVCSFDNFGGERWNCTASACEDGCLSDGVFYPVGASLSIGDLQCTCDLTGRNSQRWMCRG